MSSRSRPRRGRCRALLALLVCLLVAPPANLVADQREAVRSGIGLKIFPRVVAVEVGVAEKLAESNRLEILLVFARDREAAERFRERLASEVKQIQRWPVLAAVTSVDALETRERIPAAMMIVEPLEAAEFDGVLSFALREGRMLFSPFVGDVERGAMAGLDIGVRVAPYFNAASLSKASITIDAKVLEVSRVYE